MNNELQIKPLKDLTLMDRFLFSQVMEDPVANRLLLEIILGMEIDLHDWTQTEKEFRISQLVRNIRVDVFSMDKTGNVYDTEVQRYDKYTLPRRSRLYQGIIDSSLLPPGVINFNKLRDCCIIIISPFDLGGFERFRYTFRMRCDEVPDYELGDGGVRIFLNTKGRDIENESTEVIELLHYIEYATGNVTPTITGEKLKQIHLRVQTVRNSEETGVKYMQLWEEKLLEQQWAREEGRKLGIVQLIRQNLMQDMTVHSISAFLKLDEAIVLQVSEKIQTNPEISDEVLIDLL